MWNGCGILRRQSLLSRRDVVVVASVSCIYGLGTPQSYLDRSVELNVGDEVPRDGLLRLLVDVSTPATTWHSPAARSASVEHVEIIPSYEELAVRIEILRRRDRGAVLPPADR
jgi:excinuclease ABC subunit B